MLVQSFSEMEEMIMKHNFTITKTLIAGSDQDPTKIYEDTHGDPKDGVSWGKREAAIKRYQKQIEKRQSFKHVLTWSWIKCRK
jgi:hypothetical protein